MMANAYAPLLNHLWQSTAFGLVAAGVALTLRRYRPTVRYWLWAAASLNFLFPVALLMDLGAYFRLQGVALPTAAQSVSQAILTPVSAEPSFVGAAVQSTSPAATHLSLWLFLVAGLWLTGFLAVGYAWIREWQSIQSRVRAATPIDLGLHIRAVVSDSRMELGVFGILRPVLIVPSSLLAYVTAAQLNAILAHEMCHVRRHDNFWASLHQLAKALFWFHPLIWWAGARMASERELACDEYALRCGAQPDGYAECILRVCRFYAQAPACVAGISGADLKQRVLTIADGAFGGVMGVRMKTLLAAVFILCLAWPIAAGALNRGDIADSDQTASALPAFDVTSVRPFVPLAPFDHQAHYDPQRLLIEGMTPRELIQEAYGVQPDQMEGLPDWAFWARNRFTVVGTTNSPTAPDQMRLMLRRLLQDRFQLQFDDTTKMQPVYALVVAPTGLKVKPLKDGESCIEANDARVKRETVGVQNYVNANGYCTTAQLIFTLNLQHAGHKIDLPTVDHTGLTGNYPFGVWRTIDGQPLPDGGYERGAKVEPFQDAIAEELGLKLVKTKAPYRVLNVTRIERPGPD